MEPALSVKPWTHSRTEDLPLRDVLARVHNQHGHFRNVNEASMRADIAAESVTRKNEGDEDEGRDEDVDDSQKASTKPESLEDLMKIHHELMKRGSAAEIDVGRALDFVSSLLAKDSNWKKPAETTISVNLKNAVPSGTLGVDFWQRMPRDDAREMQKEALAVNIRMEELQHTADGLISAARRLRENVQKETRYWNEVLSISDNGWNVSRSRSNEQQNGSLSVRFGFRDSAPQFAQQAEAKLKRGPDGQVLLGEGVGTNPKSLLAVVRKNGRAVGVSKIPFIHEEEDVSLEDRVRYARDSQYDHELYQEMVRESRMLAHLGVSMAGSAIEFGTADTHISLDFVALKEGHQLGFDASHDEDALAQTAVLTARLLLNQAHGERLKEKTALPPPMSEREEEANPTPPLLRPLVFLLMHCRAIDEVNERARRVYQTLKAGGVQTRLRPANLTLPEGCKVAHSEALTGLLESTMTSAAKLVLSPPKGDEAVLGCQIETSLTKTLGPIFTLKAPSQSDTLQDDSIDGLFENVDAKLSSMLARALAEALGPGWKYNGDSMLIKEDDGHEDRASQPTLDSCEGELSLQTVSGRKIRKWVSQGSCDAGSLWDGP